MARSVARDYELLAYLTDSIGVLPKVRRAARGQLHKIEVRWPSALRRASLVIGFNLALDFAAIIPNKIDRTRMVGAKRVAIVKRAGASIIACMAVAGGRARYHA